MLAGNRTRENDQGGETALRKLRTAVIVGVAAATLASMAVVGSSAGAQSSGGGKKTLYVIGTWESTAQSATATPQYDDSAKLAVADLVKKGWDAKFEPAYGSSSNAASHEQAFLAALAKKPDGWIGLNATAVAVPVGAKVAATDMPTFSLASPDELVKNGPSGGDNIFLVRPLNRQTYAKLVEYACVDLAKQLKLKPAKISLNAVSSGFGPTVEDQVKKEIPKYKNCELVDVNHNGATASDLTQQALAVKQSGANMVISVNFPNPSGVFVNQLRQNGFTGPVIGSSSMDVAIDAGGIQSLDGLYGASDCVPTLETSKAAKQFNKLYEKTYGYAPNYAAVENWDMIHLLADVVEKVGHDYAKINKALAGTDYQGVCPFTNDKNNVLAQQVTIYKYKGAQDKTKVLVKKVPIEFIPNEALVVTTTTAAPAG